MILNPAQTTAGDICTAALSEALVIGENQSATQDQIIKSQTRLQWMLQEWQRERQLVFHLVDMWCKSTGQEYYTIGPGGNIDTNVFLNPYTKQFNMQFGPTYPISVRPAKIESAFLRQPNQGAYFGAGPFNPQFDDQFENGLGPFPGGNLPIDYPLEIIIAREDYNKIAFKPMVSLSQYLFYDSDWPLGKLFPWPVPNANIYELHVSVLAQLPPMFVNTSVVINLPYEYYNAMVLNLALRLRSLYGIATFQGDSLPGMAKNALKIVRGANLQIARLNMPSGLVTRGKGYNIFSDQFGG